MTDISCNFFPNFFKYFDMRILDTKKSIDLFIRHTLFLKYKIHWINARKKKQNNKIEKETISRKELGIKILRKKSQSLTWIRYILLILIMCHKSNWLWDFFLLVICPWRKSCNVYLYSISKCHKIYILLKCGIHR